MREDGGLAGRAVEIAGADDRGRAAVVAGREAAGELDPDVAAFGREALGPGQRAGPQVVGPRRGGGILAGEVPPLDEVVLGVGDDGAPQLDEGVVLGRTAVMAGPGEGGIAEDHAADEGDRVGLAGVDDEGPLVVTMIGLGGAVPTGSPGRSARGEELTLGRAAEEDVAGAREPRVAPEQPPHVETARAAAVEQVPPGEAVGEAEAGLDEGDDGPHGTDGGGEALVERDAVDPGDHLVAGPDRVRAADVGDRLQIVVLVHAPRGPAHAGAAESMRAHRGDARARGFVGSSGPPG
ncbi:hypothetical protein [Nannocystis exedens]|uniref:hypothetical protein n=1 Tax=Nannocystis exedens TaxID=54 RepID=UPI000BBA020D|nr:hypothetical protein [Nannocystis exedens]